MPSGNRSFDNIGQGTTGISRRKWLQALGVAGAAGLAGCQGSDDQETTTTTDDGTESDPSTDSETETETESGSRSVGGTYNSVTSSPYETLNPLYNDEYGAGVAIGYALDLNYTFAPETEPFWLHTEFETDDNEVWVVKVREGLEFGGDYGEVTAETYTYQIQEVHQSEWANTPDATNWIRDEEPINVEETGEYEFQIELPSPDPVYLESYDPQMYPIPVDLMQPYVDEEDAEGLQDDEDLLELTFTGNLGAFSLDEWNRSSGVTFSRNDDYFLQDVDDAPDEFENAPYFEGVQVDVVQEESSRLAALETGETDTAAVPPNRVQEFQDLDSTYVSVQPQSYNEICAYNMRDNGWTAGPGNLFREKEFRQGLACAVNKERLVEGVYRGFAEIEYTWQPPWSQWYPDEDDLMTFGTGDLYGPEETRSRIESAIENVDEDYRYDGENLVTPDGNQVTLSLYHSAGQNTEKNFAQFIAQEFSENAGIEVEVEAIDGVKFSEDYWQQEVPDNPDEYEWSEGPNNAGPREVTSANEWDMSVVFGLNAYPLNPLTADVFFLKDGVYNPYGYYPSWDAEGLFDKARNAESRDELKEALRDIFINISEDQPMGMLAFPSDTIGYNSSVQGPMEDYFSGWDFPAWYFEE
ncbi:ABC transporter substrate-binding protein [Halorussus salilacus]|uniref:ABC transporter substrate-binding protein n=1 Tax=Halorussus salilacus TaxID=2953750 RepID=UPI0020A22350|nr:ABC transporter substrate-binding protein [Halorussus salilacus]USZ68794.1 ABC transporter substrate-binding protein [Halorussus salilacus]